MKHPGLGCLGAREASTVQFEGRHIPPKEQCETLTGLMVQSPASVRCVAHGLI